MYGAAPNNTSFRRLGQACVVAGERRPIHKKKRGQDFLLRKLGRFGKGSKSPHPLFKCREGFYSWEMPRPPRADEAGGLYHALNRANLRSTIFQKPYDYLAFERVMHEALLIHEIELYSYELMPNHFHLVLRPLLDGEMSRFMRWVGGTHTMRYHAHYGTTGQGHIYQQRFKSFPIQDDDHFLVVCRYVERNALRGTCGTSRGLAVGIALASPPTPRAVSEIAFVLAADTSR